jgi:hypothetical protein
MAEHEFSLATIVAAWMHGMLQRILYEIPLVQPMQEDPDPPPLWLAWAYPHTWLQLLGSDLRPANGWLVAWNRIVGNAAGQWVDEVGQWAWDGAYYTMEALIGAFPAIYASFSGWITSIAMKLGANLPGWCMSAINGLEELWLRLPAEIREQMTDWYTWVNGFLNTIYQWAMDRYDAAVQYATGAYTWVLGSGEVLKQWRLAVMGTIDAIMADPVGWVTGKLGGAWTWVVLFWMEPYHTVSMILGQPWTRLVTFSADCLTYWYNLWSQSGDVLAAFLADPMGWLYDRVEDKLIERW